MLPLVDEEPKDSFLKSFHQRVLGQSLEWALPLLVRQEGVEGRCFVCVL